MLCTQSGSAPMSAHFANHRAFAPQFQQQFAFTPQFAANSATARTPQFSQLGYSHPQQHNLTFVPESPQMMHQLMDQHSRGQHSASAAEVVHDPREIEDLKAQLAELRLQIAGIAKDDDDAVTEYTPA